MPVKTASSNTSPAIAGQLRQLQALQKGRLRLALLLALCNSALLIGQYGLLAWLLNQWLQHSVNPEFSTTALPALLPVFIALAACMLLRPVLHYGRERLCLTASLQIRRQLRDQVLTRLAQPAAQLAHSDSEGALASRVLDQVDALDGYLQRYVVQARLAVLVPLLLVAVITPFSWLAALLLLLTAPLVPLFMIILGNAASASSRKQLQALSRLGGRFLDLVRGMRTLQQLQATAQAQEQVAQAAAGYRQRTMAVLRLAFLSSAVLEFFAALSIALVAVYLGLGLLGILPWAKETIPVPYTGALFILLLAPEFYAPLRQLGNDYHAKADAEAALQELEPLLQQSGWQHSGAQPLQGSLPADIQADNLQVVSADGRQRLQLDRLHLPAGQSLLLQGASGAGKSTVLQVLLGALPYQGSLTVNGQDFAELQLDSWLDGLDYLAQTPHFIEGSLADNLRLAQPEATGPQMRAALEQVGLGELLAGRGLDWPLQERGSGLSGGQLSRLALARLLLRDRPLWLLDEPTAHLDPDSRRQIHQLLQQLGRGRSLILVSHSSIALDWVDQRLELSAAGGTDVCT